MNEEETKLGDYIFMGMGKCAGKTVCLSVAYKIDYCIKKAKSFEVLAGGIVKFTKINKVKVGELEAFETLTTEGKLIKNN